MDLSGGSSLNRPSSKIDMVPAAGDAAAVTVVAVVVAVVSIEQLSAGNKPGTMPLSDGWEASPSPYDRRLPPTGGK